MFQTSPVSEPLFAGFLPEKLLPQGLPAQAVHELRAPAGSAANLAFAVALLAGLSAPILWLGREVDAYPPGLAWAGLDPARCLFAQADETAGLAGLEVALRGGMAGLLECRMVSRLAARRLAFAAREGGGTGFVLRHAPARTQQDSNAFATRWMVSPLPGNRLQAELLYARAGRPGTVILALDGKEAQHGTSPALPVVSVRAA
jgi:protein ImuA